MHWDRMFEDLEGQLASEWEAERAALDAESERLRISRMPLRSRLRTLCAQSTRIGLELTGGSALTAQVLELGADWVLADAEGEPGICAIPLAQLIAIRADHGVLLSSLGSDDRPASVRERMTLGFLLRDLARRRVPVQLHDVNGIRYGTLDRAGSDHVDLAEHDPGTARRAADVRGFRTIPFSAIVRVRFGSM